MLVRAAHSANIKERRDARARCSTPTARWSCRPSTSPSTSARCPPRSRRSPARTTQPGVAWVLNDPYAGGTHLPDITVITPAFAGGELLGFAANRAHHADVGGPTPGSMPADSHDARGRGRRDRAAAARRGRDRASSSPQMRQPAQRRADLRAQLAANRTGRRRGCASCTSRDAARGGDGGDDRLRRAAHARVPRGARRTARARRRDVLEARRRRPRAAARRRPSTATS